MEEEGDGGPKNPNNNKESENLNLQFVKDEQDINIKQDYEGPSPLINMINQFPPSSSPSSSPTDLDMEPEDDGPPPGWDNKYQLNEPVEQPLKPAAVSFSSDVQAEDVQQDAHKEERETRSQAHPSPPPELASSDIQVEQEDSEDDGPPPGWDSKCQPEPKLQTPCPTTPQSDIKMEDVRKDASNEEVQLTPEIPLDIKVDQQDSEDEGPPPGWDSKCLSDPELQSACSRTPQLDIKMEDVQQDARNEDDPPSQSQSGSHPSPAPEQVPSGIEVEEQDSEDDGPPPGWDSKCQLEPKSQMACPTVPLSDIKMEEVQQNAQSEDVPEPQLQAHSNPASELVTSDRKVKEQNSEDGEPKLQMSCPTTPPSDTRIKMGDDQQDEQGPPPGWGSTPEQKSQVHSRQPSPIVPSGAKIGYEQNYVEVAEEIPQPPSRQQSIPPTKPQMSVLKPPMAIDNPEMGQMVCGSCRHLLSYPRGARYVECACCLEENYVLEEHEVGQVVCSGCNVLLMYPYGAPKVRCVNCSAETQIGDQNRRPPLSEHQSRARRHFKRVQVR